MEKKVIIFLFLWIFIACKSDKEQTEIKPIKTTITESVYASVTVKPAVRYFAQPLNSGIIKKTHIQEGDTVQKNQILFEIEPSVRDEVQLKNAQLSLDEAQSNYFGKNSLLQSLDLEIETMQRQVETDSINFNRLKRLQEQNIGKRIDFEQAELKYRSTQNQLKLLKSKKVQTRVSLEKNYIKAQNQLTGSSRNLNDFMVRSEIDGKVYAITKEEGDFVSFQEKIAEIGSRDEYVLEMDIDEIDITKIKLNDSVLVVLDAYPSKAYVAHLSRIFDKKNELTRTFRVEGKFDQLPPKLYYGLSGEANIVVATRTNTLIIPTAYLLPNNQVRTEDGPVDVQVGLKNLENVEILSGIDSNTTLLKPDE